MSESQSKVTADHLCRDAYLYVRQSTMRQVIENTESAMRQYDLRGRAVALGWPAERVIVIDVDQGLSGASAADREGFQRLVADVSLKKAGIVLGLECSRLARNNSDWHRLLELCALTDTLICDEDGLYDPGSINDRLLLGLKGAMSEAELHILRSRLRGGVPPRPAAASCAPRCRSASSMTPWERWRSIPTRLCKARSVTCWNASSGPARHAPWSRNSTHEGCPSPSESAAVRARVRSSGRRFTMTGC